MKWRNDWVHIYFLEIKDGFREWKTGAMPLRSGEEVNVNHLVSCLSWNFKMASSKGKLKHIGPTHLQSG